ncbi:MAG TPA: helix-turn-helix transcriptional regulator [Firmicutes bacterium]|nr:helix-turn-helix transcriptional regulator [Bacillota bacterium]
MLTVLRLQRQLKGLSQTALAQRAGLRSDFLCRIENRRVVASRQQRQHLAKALGSTEGKLFEEAGLARIWEGKDDAR